jgi:hypothetical protein
MQWLGQRLRAEEPVEPAEAREAEKAAEGPSTSPSLHAPESSFHRIHIIRSPHSMSSVSVCQ